MPYAEVREDPSGEMVEFLLLPKRESKSEVITFDRSIKCTVQNVHAYEFGTAFTLAFMFLDNITKAGSFFLLKWLLLLLLVQNEFTEPKDEILFSKISCRPPALLLVGFLGNILPNKILKEAGQFAKPFCERKPGDSVLPTSLEVDSKGSKKPNLECIRKVMKKQNTSEAKFIEMNKFCTSGTIEIASGGIAYFPNLELYKKKELTNLIYESVILQHNVNLKRIIQ
ncbi:hypothetical protein KSF78_0001365 [Schistosoma japonicum]|nr:hypothetical protein KSF78_0001365 [Schistosoma japonicum]